MGVIVLLSYNLLMKEGEAVSNIILQPTGNKIAREHYKNTIENKVALCPNCHKKMHILNDKDEVLIMK